MSDTTDSGAEELGRWGRVREPLRPRAQERRGKGTVRRIETAVLLLVFAVFAVATVNDLVREVHGNSRLSADLLAWRRITSHVYHVDHFYHNLSLQQDLKHYTTRDVVCGNTTPGPPGTKPQICLIFTGPVVHMVRKSLGGFYLPAYLPDISEDRYACFGTASSEHLCELSTPPGAPHQPVLLRGG